MNHKEYYFKNRERILQRMKLYSLQNADKIKKYKKSYRAKSAAKVRLDNTMWRQKNREYIQTKNIEYYRKNKQKFIDDARVYYHRVIKRDPRRKLAKRISSLIRAKLRRRLLNKKHAPAFKFLPYTVDQLKEWLEKRFQPGMSWENYGKWHIDHKIPDASFDYKRVEDEQFVKCWSLENLQPLWALENIKKGKKLPKQE